MVNQALLLSDIIDFTLSPTYRRLVGNSFNCKMSCDLKVDFALFGKKYSSYAIYSVQTNSTGIPGGISRNLCVNQCS